MKKLWLPLLVILTLGATTALAEFENSSVVGQVPDRIIIILKNDLFPTVSKDSQNLEIDVPALNALAERFEVKDMSQLYPWVKTAAKVGEPDLRLHWAVDFSDRYDLETVRAAYEALPEVAEAWAVDICRVFDVPNDPSLGLNQWYARNLTLGEKDVRAVGGWNEATGDTNIVVAIVDSGVDWMHPDLGGTGPDYIDGDIYINWTEWNGTPGVDDDANGFIDDWRGWDFVDLSPGAGHPGEDVEDEDNDPMDFEGHGTGCAGVAAAMTDNGVGISGIGYNCRVLAVRVGWLPAGSDIGVVRMDFASQGMVYAALNGANIVNCSWGSTSYLSTAVTICTGEDCMVVTAAGNDDADDAPYLGTHPSVLAVAATNQIDAKASFSNFGSWIELSAPGVLIYTTWYNGSTGEHMYQSVQGTSFSSPIICGVAALIWSAHPTWLREQVIDLMLDSCDEIDSVNPGYVGELGAGRPNLLKALGDSFQQVPDEFPTIVDAMNESAPGDTVAILGSEVLSGTQVIISRDIYILGGYDAGYTSRDPIGNPTAMVGSPTETAMQFQAGAGLGTIVDGFRCTNGSGVLFSGTPYTGRYGGGVICTGASPTLRNIEVTGNAVGDIGEIGSGGGLYLYNSSAMIEDCQFHGNTANYGSGVMIYQGAPTFMNCEIYDNPSYTDDFANPPIGGGLHIIDSEVTLIGCRISGHDEVDMGGGIYSGTLGGTNSLTMEDNEIYDNLAKDYGGGIYMAGNSLVMNRDSIHDNGPTAGAAFMDGGGIYTSVASASLDSINCHANMAQIDAGAVFTGCTTADITNSLFTRNAAVIFAGGLSLQNIGGGSLAGNTIAENQGLGSGAAGVYMLGTSITVNKNIVAFNTGGTAFANGFQVSSGSPPFLCNDVYGNVGTNYGGIVDQTGTNGNISEDPDFCDMAAADYGIDDASPCAPAHSGGCGLIGALAATDCDEVSVAEDGPATPLAFIVKPNYPNPFNPATRIEFSLPKDAYTTVKVFDLAGRLVRTVLAEPLPSAVHTVTWDGRDDRGRSVAAGVYFYRVRSGQHEYTGRMALVK